MWKVYKRTCPNGRVYIGITSRSLDERMQGGYKNNREFALAIIKYGKDAIVSEVLEEHENYDTALEREIYYINKYADICYNKIKNSNIKGVPCTVRTAQTCLHRRACTEASPQKGTYKQYIVPLTTKPTNRHACPVSVYNLNGNYIRTYETAAIAAKELNVNKGDVISCCKGMRSDGQPRYHCKGLIFRYAVDKLDEYPERAFQCKKVNQYTLDGEYIRTFDSIKDAWLHTGAPANSIGSVCKGLLKSSGGYVWKYIEQEKEVG